MKTKSISESKSTQSLSSKSSNEFKHIEPSNYTAFNGVVILTLALIIVKILSAIYRVPYQNVLGDTGLYAYQQIYPIVALGMILSMNAIPSAVTQTLGINGQPSSFSIYEGTSNIYSRRNKTIRN